MSTSKDGFQKITDLPDLLRSNFEKSLEKSNNELRNQFLPLTNGLADVAAKSQETFKRVDEIPSLLTHVGDDVKFSFEKSLEKTNANITSQFSPLIQGFNEVKSKSELSIKKLEELPSILTHFGDDIKGSLTKGFDPLVSQGQNIISKIGDLPNLINQKMEDMNRFFLSQFFSLSDNFNRLIIENLKMATGKIEDGVTKVIPRELQKVGDETRHAADIVRSGLEEKVLPVLKDVAETGIKLITAPSKILDALGNALANPIISPIALTLGALIILK